MACSNDQGLSQSFVQIRSAFPRTRGGPYLDLSTRCLLCKEGRAALERHLQEAEDGSVNNPVLLAQIEEMRQLFGSLVGGHADEIAFTRNVTDGIAALAGSSDLREGDESSFAPNWNILPTSIPGTD
jgi:cysteine desulfurase/selenocysteine lyase